MKVIFIEIIVILTLLVILSCVDVTLCGLPFAVGVVGELAAVSLLTQSLLEERTENGFRVHAI